MVCPRKTSLCSEPDGLQAADVAATVFIAPRREAWHFVDACRVTLFTATRSSTSVDVVVHRHRQPVDSLPSPVCCCQRGEWDFASSRLPGPVRFIPGRDPHSGRLSLTSTGVATRQILMECYAPFDSVETKDDSRVVDAERVV